MSYSSKEEVRYEGVLNFCLCPKAELVLLHNDIMRYYMPLYLDLKSAKSSTTVSDSFLMLIGRTAAVSQQISPKLKSFSTILT